MPLPTAYALVGAPCLADGHPSACSEPAEGTIENADGESPLTVDGTPVADHGDAMHFDSHGHSTDAMGNCIDYQTHDLTPDQAPPWTIDGRPLVLEGNDTTDPGSGGRAWVDDAGQSAFKLVD